MSKLGQRKTEADKTALELDAEIALIAEEDPVAKRLQQLRGVGPMIATAMVATVGSATHFANGRQMAAALGLTPNKTVPGGRRACLASASGAMLTYACY